jgi:5'-3' exonuclease
VLYGEQMNAQTDKKRVMIIDGLNLFIRNFIINPSISIHGPPIGGLRGFLQSTQKLIREVKPDMVVVAWDGSGGSRKRRQQNKNYKEGRAPLRINRPNDLTEEQQKENMQWQTIRLMEYLNELPIIQYRFDEVEADDVIAYLTQINVFDGWEKVVVSSDKDFLQLCDDETILYRPIQNKVHNKLNIIKEFDIHPRNFALARAIAGDASDNLKGVPGAGLKTIAKNLKFLREGKEVSLSDVFDYCEKTTSKSKFLSNVLENKEIVEDNYSLMQLYRPSLSLQCKDKVRYALDNFEYDYNKTEIIKMMIHDGFGTFNWDELHGTMHKICVDKPLESK